jgi:hypothetical protein
MASYLFAAAATLIAGALTGVIFIANGSKTSGEFIGRNFIALAWMVVCVLWLIATWPAHAHDHDNPGMNDWLKSLHSSGGAWCCNGDDTDPIDDWERRGDRYRVKFRGEWFDVPDSAVIGAPNRGGGALLWMNKGYSGMAVRCFLPGTLS